MMEISVARTMRIIRHRLSHLGAAIVLISIVFATVLSAAHQPVFDMNFAGSAYEQTTHGVVANDGNTIAEAVDVVPCAARILCHMQLAVTSNADCADGPLNHLSLYCLPGLGTLLVGQIVDVATPPPLAMRLTRTFGPGLYLTILSSPVRVPLPADSRAAGEPQRQIMG